MELRGWGLVLFLGQALLASVAGAFTGWSGLFLGGLMGDSPDAPELAD